MLFMRIFGRFICVPFVQKGARRQSGEAMRRAWRYY